MTDPTPTPAPVDLAELRRLLAAATDGPWRRWPSEAQKADHIRSEDGMWVAQFVVTPEDARLIAALRNAAPWLLDRAAAVARVEALLSEAERGEGIVITPGFTTYHAVECGLLRAALDGSGVAE